MTVPANYGTKDNTLGDDHALFKGKENLIHKCGLLER